MTPDARIFNGLSSRFNGRFSKKKMTPSLNFHTKIMNSLHAVLYTLVDITQLWKGKVSDFEWSARLIGEGMVLFQYG